MILATSRLTLREAEPDDALALSAYQNDPRYLEHYSERADAVRIIELARRWANASPRVNYQLIVTLDPEGLVIGCAGLRQAGYPPREAEVGIEIHPNHWGFGYAREALSRIIAFAQDDFALTRLSAVTTPTNRRAHSLLQHLGFASASSIDHEAWFQLALSAA